jgi:hypothetical protein
MHDDNCIKEKRKSVAVHAFSLSTDLIMQIGSNDNESNQLSIKMISQKKIYHYQFIVVHSKHVQCPFISTINIHIYIVEEIVINSFLTGSSASLYFDHE